MASPSSPRVSAGGKGKRSAASTSPAPTPERRSGGNDKEEGARSRSSPPHAVGKSGGSASGSLNKSDLEGAFLAFQQQNAKAMETNN
eukprot:8446027-Karenia_brevis.AAC.1